MRRQGSGRLLFIAGLLLVVLAMVASLGSYPPRARWAPLAVGVPELALLGGLLAAGLLRRRAATAARPAAAAEEAGGGSAADQAQAFAWLLGAGALVWLLGMVWGLSLFAAGFLAVRGRMPWIACVAVAVGVGVAVWGLLVFGGLPEVRGLLLSTS